MKRFVTLLLAALAVAGCDTKPSADLAPTATSLASAKPASAEAVKLDIDKASSKVEFAMEAPKEKIRGRVSGDTDGALSVDLKDVTKTTGLIAVDLDKLEIFQTVMGDDGKASEETKSETQNEHAQTWLEISKDAPEADRMKNRRVEFSIQKVETAGEKDVTKLTGADRKVMLTASGDFLLHGRKAPKTAELEATFHFDGDKFTSVSVKSVKPFAVGLAEHDVKPRESFGKLAAKTLDLLSPKVAKEALVSVEFTAKPGGSAAKPAESGAPAAP